MNIEKAGIVLEDLFQEAAQSLREARTRPHGPNPGATMAKEAGKACVSLCDGDTNRARTLWKQIVKELGADYMPKAAAVALIWAANTTNLVPDVEAPEPT